jgi:hypothetical protein
LIQFSRRASHVVESIWHLLLDAVLPFSGAHRDTHVVVAWITNHATDPLELLVSTQYLHQLKLVFELFEIVDSSSPSLERWTMDTCFLLRNVAPTSSNYKHLLDEQEKTPEQGPMNSKRLI